MTRQRPRHIVIHADEFNELIGDTFERRGSDAVWQRGRFVRPGRLSHRSRRTVAVVWMTRSA